MLWRELQATAGEMHNRCKHLFACDEEKSDLLALGSLQKAPELRSVMALILDAVESSAPPPRAAVDQWAARKIFGKLHNNRKEYLKRARKIKSDAAQRAVENEEKAVEGFEEEGGVSEYGDSGVSGGHGREGSSTDVDDHSVNVVSSGGMLLRSGGVKDGHGSNDGDVEDVEHGGMEKGGDIDGVEGGHGGADDFISGDNSSRKVVDGGSENDSVGGGNGGVDGGVISQSSAGKMRGSRRSSRRKETTGMAGDKAASRNGLDHSRTVSGRVKKRQMVERRNGES